MTKKNGVEKRRIKSRRIGMKIVGNNVDLSHLLFGTFFLKKLGLKSIEQKKVLNEGVMTCSINMESTFLVALARRASKISEDLAECVKADIFFSLFSPSIPSLEKLVQVFDEHFRNNKSLWAEFFAYKFRCFRVNQNPGRNLADSP